MLSVSTTVVSPQTGRTLTLTFDQGRVFGSSGCNTYHALYTSEGNRLAIGSVASTRKACSAEGVVQQERRVSRSAGVRQGVEH